MSTEILRPGPVAARPAPRRASAVLRTIALLEAWRFVRHPLNLFGLVNWMIAVGVDSWDGPRPAFTNLTAPMTLFWGVLVFFAANLVASSARRADAEELLDGLPSGSDRRTGGLCLAALGPFALACTAQAVLAGLYLVTGNELERFPTVAEMLSGPLNVLGAGLLGVAVARWLPWPGMSVLVMVGLVAGNMAIYEKPDVWLLSLYADFAIWGPPPYLAAQGFLPGNADLHAVYLFALCVGAGALAMLRDPDRRPVWLGVGAVSVITVVAAGIGQLP